MKNIVIFAGTTEGHRLSDMLAENRIPHHVCVASKYGSDIMPKNKYATLHVGRMDASDMSRFFLQNDIKKGDMIVDATHPYAVEVTKNIETAVNKEDLTYIRVLRDSTQTDEEIRLYDSIEECAESINKTEGNILMTTGSKELKIFCDMLSDEVRKRTYVRVLPVTESLMICEQAGIEPSHIIAMHGPFSYEMNKAMMTMYDIKHIVTKDSGLAGGFEEKLRAASDMNAEAHVISRPVSEKGMDIFGAFEIIAGKKYVYDKKRQIYIVGYGPGNERLLTYEAKEATDKADAVFGAKRLIENIHDRKAFDMYKPEEIMDVLKKDPAIQNAAVLVSGDGGFFSAASSMVQLFSKEDDFDVHTISGISSVAYLASWMKVNYDDARIMSIHGRKSVNNILSLFNSVRYNKKTFVLLSNAEDVNMIGNMILTNDLNCKIVIGCDLSYESEMIETLTASEAIGYNKKGVLTALIINDDPQKEPLIPVYEDSGFLRDKVPMTKQSIRHESIIRLNIKKGDVLYDIGGGTGSVAIEAAGLDPSVSVYTFEIKKQACDLIKENINKFNAANVTLIEGDAVKTLKDMSAPDCVFVGGSGGKLFEIIDIIKAKKEHVRYVINAVSLETICDLKKLLSKYDVQDVYMTQTACTDIENIGSYHMMKAQNPVIICSFTL
ncbi:MAG: precorrin-6A reductase [Lachnospiraceae bacterium]|nr:precorrin-6A reductase [Lachnospiraceae bacterium]